MAEVTIKAIKQMRGQLTIVGISPLIQHRWGAKAEKEMAERGQGRKTKDREPRTPEADCDEAAYRTHDGKFGVPLLAIKSAIITAAHKDIGIEKTLVRKSFFMLEYAPLDKVLPMQCDEYVMREDHVKVGMSKADLRHRPMFNEWSVTFEFIFDADLLRLEDIVTLVDRAGFGVGICEWRPEKGGDFGRFQVDTSKPVTAEPHNPARPNAPAKRTPKKGGRK